MKSAVENIEAILAQCNCTEGYHFNAITKAGNVVYTDGIATLVKECECMWLVSEIANLQRKAMQDPMLQEFQIWELTKSGHEAVLTCSRDTDDVAFSKPIPFTDFPLDHIKVFLCPGETSFGNGVQRRVMVSMLTSEY